MKTNVLYLTLLFFAVMAFNNNANPSPDFDGDGTVGLPDFLLFVEHFGLSQSDAGYDARYDLDGSHTIGMGDFLIFVSNFGKEIPSSSEGVTIPDANLRSAIEAALGKTSGTPTTEAEIETLTYLSAGNTGIRDLTGLEYATNLKNLWLRNNNITDISALAGLTNLTELALWGNNITDISALSGLTNLTDLSLNDNNITDISALSGLTNLTYLGLSNNDITDISALSSLTNLTSLRLGNNDITDISALSGLTNLTYLGLWDNSFTDISALAGLTNLTSLWLTNIPIADISALDISALAGLTNLTELTLSSNNITDISALSGLTNLTYLTLGFNIADISALSGLTNLTSLGLSSNNITDISALSGLTNLTYLGLSNNNITDISALSGLTNLTSLGLGDNNITDISALSGLTNLTDLRLNDNNITDISALSGLTNLTDLRLNDNNITDISALSGLTNLTVLHLWLNNISDLAPLVANTGLDSEDKVDVRGNPLNAASISTHISTLQDRRGVTVSFDDIINITAPQIYNDNVFVLPVAENLEIGTNLPVEKYSARFYEHFSDEFDFLMFVSNLDHVSNLDPEWCSSLARYHPVKNDVQGLGQPIISNNDWGSTGKLQGVIHFAYYDTYSYYQRQSLLTGGIGLHELIHRWANNSVPTIYPYHWGFCSANGHLGGFDIANLVELGGGQYTAGQFDVGHHFAETGLYSPIELYLAGFIPPEEVPDLWVAEDGTWLRDEEGHIVRANSGYMIFTASRIRTYTIEDIIAEHGPRIPDHSQAQKDFRAAVILLINEDYPVKRQNLESLSDDVSWLSYPGQDETDKYNFYEATGGRGTITMGGLSQFQSRPR